MDIMCISSLKTLQNFPHVLSISPFSLWLYFLHELSHDFRLLLCRVKGEDSPPVLSTFLPVPEGSSSTTTGTPPDFLLHSQSTLKRKTATSFRDPLQPSPPPPLSLNTPIPQSPRHQRKHPPTPPSVPPPPTPDSESNTPTPTSMSQPQFPSQATSHYQTPSSPPRMRAFPHDNSFKKKSTAPPVAPPPPPPRYSPVTSQPPASTPALQTTQDGYALPQVASLTSPEWLLCVAFALRKQPLSSFCLS